ncbi:MAG: molecular chaperone TorD family protein [Deltaproteobacteria bacterium]|nr:molecular chaperone TorD family protein [Deltaproteobacteria bacterium]
MTEPLSDAEVARGRGRAYALLADLVSRGPTASTLPPARTSAVLAEALDSYADLDDAAADHQHVFGLSVPPFEGVYRDPEGQVGGACTDRLRDRYAALGFAHDPRGEGVEHLSTQLRALAFLSVAEADAREDDATPQLDAVCDLARDFLDAHLLLWLPSFAVAARAAGRALPTAIVDQIMDVVVIHRQGLDVPDDHANYQLQGEPLDLDDPAVGIREIAAALAVPARIGALLTRDDIARVGRGQRVPRGFGERRTTIHNLLNSAAGLGSLGGVVDDLRALLSERRHVLDDRRFRTVPGLGDRVGVVRARLLATDEVLARLSEATRDGSVTLTEASTE